jgi:hypothetical protein
LGGLSRNASLLRHQLQPSTLLSLPVAIAIR